MGVILQANYRVSSDPTVSVPAPIDGKGDDYFYDHIAKRSQEFAKTGFTHIMGAPPFMTIGGAAPTSDGYGVFNHYHLGTRLNPTRFGFDEIYQRMCAVQRCNGLVPLVDWVPHQCYGGNKGHYDYSVIHAGGIYKQRFCKISSYFIKETTPGGVERDDVFDVANDFGFGDEFAPENSVDQNGANRGIVLRELIEVGNWLINRLDLGGTRDDDIKGQSFNAVNTWINSKAMRGAIHIGEYAEGNAGRLAYLVDLFKGLLYFYDFEIKYRLRDMCNNGSRWDMRQLVGAGLLSRRPFQAVTFMENPDTDTTNGEQAIFNKLLGYAYILTAEGWPSIYYRDYAEEPNCYGLKKPIDNLIWIHEHLANGATEWLKPEYQYGVFKRTSGLIVGLNNDIWGGWKHPELYTGYGEGTMLHDYSGHCQYDVRVGAYGKATIAIPPNENGKGYCCLFPYYQENPIQVVSDDYTTQIFEGDFDLLEGPAVANMPIKVQAIWCDADTHIRIRVIKGPELTDYAVWGGSYLLEEATSEKLIRYSTSMFKVKKAGWHVIVVTSKTSVAYKIGVTYRCTGLE